MGLGTQLHITPSRPNRDQNAVPQKLLKGYYNMLYSPLTFQKIQYDDGDEL